MTKKTIVETTVVITMNEQDIRKLLTEKKMIPDGWDYHSVTPTIDPADAKSLRITLVKTDHGKPETI